MKLSSKDYIVGNKNPISLTLKKRGKSMKSLIASKSHHFSRGFGSEAKDSHRNQGGFRISRNSSVGSGNALKLKTEAMKFNTTYNTSSKKSHYSIQHNFSKSHYPTSNNTETKFPIPLLKNVGGLARISQMGMKKFEKDLRKLNLHYIQDKKEDKEKIEQMKKIEEGLKEMDEIDLNIWSEKRHKIGKDIRIYNPPSAVRWTGQGCRAGVPHRAPGDCVLQE